MKIEIKNYSKKIDSNVVLDNINATLESGKVYGFKGKNGSGKTMLMRAICGLISPTEGEIVIDGKVIRKDITFPESLGILIENPGFLADYTGFDNLKMLADIKGIASEDDIKEAIRMSGLDPDDKRKYRKYSLGMKQKLGIAAAFMENASLIILDEPTNALDEDSVSEFFERVRKEREKGKLIILSCHDSEELYKISDEILYIENGRLKGSEKLNVGQNN